MTPFTRLIPLTAPTGETEAEFWRRKALERSQRITALDRMVAGLRDTITIYEEEDR